MSNAVSNYVKFSTYSRPAVLLTVESFVFDFRSVAAHLMSSEVLGVVAANIGIKDLIQTAVCFINLSSGP